MDYCKFNIKLTLGDYRIFNFFHSFGSTKKALILVSLIVSLYPFLIYNYLTKQDKILLVVIIVSGAMFLLATLIGLTIYLYSKKVFESDKYLQEEQSFEIDDKAIKVSSNSINSVYKWSELYKCVETKGYFFIYIANIKAIIIPKRQLKDEQCNYISKKIQGYVHGSRDIINNSKSKPKDF